MTSSDTRPTVDLSVRDSYDVDALLYELGAPAEAAEEELLNLCQTVEDLYSRRARFLIADIMGEFLDGRRLTPTEFLHTVEPQHQFQEWYRRTAVLEILAAAQARAARRTQAKRLEELKELEEKAALLTTQRAHRGTPPAFDAHSFPATVRKIYGATKGFSARYTVDALLASWLAESGSFEMKLGRLLTLDSDAMTPDAVEAIDQVVGEILASPAAIDEVFGWVEGLRPTLEVLIQVWKGERISQPGATAVTQRLAAFMGAREPPAARQGLEITLHRALTGDGRLSPLPYGFDERGTTAIMDEMVATGALAGKLKVGSGFIGGERTAVLLDRRIARWLGEERLEALLKGKTLHARLIDLLTLESAATGDLSRKILLGAVERHIGSRDFLQRLFETARTPRARIKALADLQRRIARSTLPDAMKERYGRMMDELQFTYLRTNHIFARIAKDRSPTVEEVMEYANLCAEGSFTEGKCLGQARELIGHHVRSTAFLRGYLQRYKNETEGRAERFAQFFGTLSAAGVGLRDMSTLRVLLAEDEPAARAYVEMILRDLGITTIGIARDGREALGMFQMRQSDYDLIICDWKMPRLSGLEFLKIVRGTRPDMPFLMVTALATMIAVEEALAHDVTAYIAKPFSPEQLEEKILVLVNRP